MYRIKSMIALLVFTGIVGLGLTFAAMVSAGAAQATPAGVTVHEAQQAFDTVPAH